MMTLREAYAVATDNENHATVTFDLAAGLLADANPTASQLAIVKAQNQRMRDVLIDVAFMIQNETDYIATGRHVGQPMRDCLGQWRSLARDARELS